MTQFSMTYDIVILHSYNHTLSITTFSSDRDLVYIVIAAIAAMILQMCNSAYHILIQILISSSVYSYRGDVAIDDVVFGAGCKLKYKGVLPTAPPTQPPTAPPCDPALFDCGNGNCVNKTLLCNFLDECGNHADEKV